MSAESSFFVTGGTVPLDSASYVERQADTELLSALLVGGAFADHVTLRV